MAEGGVNDHWVPFEVLERYQGERRCMNCKKRSFHDMVTCEKCREFSYCSIECLELNRAKHKPQCDVISVKKGTAILLDRNMVKSIKEKAKLLDEEGNVAVKENIQGNTSKNNPPNGSQRAGETTTKRRPRKKRNRRKGKGKTTNVPEAKKNTSPAPDIASSLAGGKFGCKVIVDDTVQKGTMFGGGWWKPKREKDSGSAKVDETSGASHKKQPKSRFPEYDTDADSDVDGPGPESRADEVSENMRATSSGSDEKPLVGSLPPEKLKDSPGSTGDSSNVKAGDHPGSTANVDKVKASHQVGRAENGSVTSNVGTADEIKGGTAPHARSQGGKVEDSEPASSGTGAANTLDEHARGHPTKTGMELVPYDKQKVGEAEAAAGGRGPREPPKLEQCHFCDKESYTMLKCSRCKWGRYCNRSCQKEDFPKHKEMCKWSEIFLKALQELPFVYLVAEYMQIGGPRLSTRLGDLSNEFEYLFLGERRPILLKILGPYFHLSRHGVVVMDQEGAKTHIMFYNQSNIYFHVSNEMLGMGLPIHLKRCLKPGNFILLLNACWHGFLDGSVGIRVDDLQHVHFVFMD
ncbi:unnamed protein product [Lymnaea stagnalis]|uniref:MYND-type domain-containing protein n=1 Tax=Lymnaea stagnalis TaxID=6523 RepID=A0AAV2H5S2_LYMST